MRARARARARTDTRTHSWFPASAASLGYPNYAMTVLSPSLLNAASLCQQLCLKHQHRAAPAMMRMMAIGLAVLHVVTAIRSMPVPVGLQPHKPTVWRGIKQSAQLHRRVPISTVRSRLPIDKGAASCGAQIQTNLNRHRWRYQYLCQCAVSTANSAEDRGASGGSPLPS